MNKRDKAILSWVEKHRPDCLRHIKQIFDDRGGRNDHNDALLLLICIAFEAGRQFQHSNKELELDNPNVY